MGEESEIKSHKVMELDAAKRERIINAAMREFKSGYKKASTDAIVREAGISKGLLFHYFGTKEKLFEFIVAYAIDLSVNEYYGLINFTQADLLERIWQTMLLKIDITYKYPDIFDFLAAVYSRPAEFPDTGFMQWYKKLRGELSQQLFKDIDITLFKDGLDIKRTVNIIWWTLTGYAESEVSTQKGLDEYKKEYDRYLSEIKEYFDIFRKVFYK